MRKLNLTGTTTSTLYLNLLFLIILIIQIEPIYSESCSTTNQRELYCRVHPVDVNYHPEANATFLWPTSPYGLRTFYFLESHMKSKDLIVSTTIRWRLPETSAILPTAIEGFLITVIELNNHQKKPLLHNITNIYNNNDNKNHLNNKTMTIWKYEAKLEHSISQISQAHSQVEFYLNSYELFNFGKKYKIEVALLPLAMGGIANQIRAIPDNVVDPATCHASKETADLAKYWNLKILSVHVMIVQAAVNVSFIAAPDSLCINRYSIQLHIKDNPIIMEYIVNKTSDAVQHHLLEGLPREQYVTIKIVPYSYPGERCPCAFCNCIMTKSSPFIIPSLKKNANVTSTKQPTIISTEYGIAFLGLLIVLLVLLAGFSLITLACVVKKRNQPLSQRVLLRNGLISQKLLECPKQHRVLLVSAHGSDSEIQFVDDMARLLNQCPTISLIYDRFDQHMFERNIHIWTNKYITECDKIILVHSRYSSTNKTTDLVYTIQKLLPLRDERVIFVKLHAEANIYNNVQETVYLVPRDIQYLCSHLSIDYDKNWQTLTEKAKNIYVNSPIQDISLLNRISCTYMPSLTYDQQTDDPQYSMISTDTVDSCRNSSSVRNTASLSSTPIRDPVIYSSSLPDTSMDSGYQSKSSCNPSIYLNKS